MYIYTYNCIKKTIELCNHIIYNDNVNLYMLSA